MDLGAFSLSDIYPGEDDTAATRLADIVTYGIATERHGLDIFGVGEHHSPSFAVSSPAVVLAGIAQATSRITLTTAATVLSVLDPVRVYEDFSTLDILSGGRAEIIAGRSAFIEPFALFGLDVAQLDVLFAEKLDLLLRLRRDTEVSWNGATRAALTKAQVSPRGTRQLPIWAAVGGSPESAQRAGTLGLPMALGFIGGSLEHPRRLVDIYREAGARAGHSDSTFDVGITSHFYIGDTAQSARDDIYPYYRRYLSPETNKGRGWHVDRPSMDAVSARGGALMVGEPAEIVEKILDLHTHLGASRFLGQVDFGGQPRAMVLDSIARFGDIVAPAVRHALNH